MCVNNCLQKEGSYPVPCLIGLLLPRICFRFSLLYSFDVILAPNQYLWSSFCSQMFHLMPTPQGSFYVLNDIFRLNYAWREDWLKRGATPEGVKHVSLSLLNFKHLNEHWVFLWSVMFKVPLCLSWTLNRDIFSVIGWVTARSPWRSWVLVKWIRNICNCLITVFWLY